MAFEGPDIPSGALCAFGQFTIRRRCIGEKDIVGGMLINTGQIELADVQVAIRADAIERFIAASRTRDWRAILSQEVCWPQSRYSISADSLQAQFAQHESLADVQVAVITAAARQA